MSLRVDPFTGETWGVPQERAAAQMQSAKTEAHRIVRARVARIAEGSAPCIECGLPVRGALSEYPAKHADCFDAIFG